MNLSYSDVTGFLQTVQKKIGKRFPDDEDLSGTVDALLRLQDLYQLTTDQIASGQLHSDIAHPVPMKRKIILCFD